MLTFYILILLVSTLLLQEYYSNKKIKDNKSIFLIIASMILLLFGFLETLLPILYTNVFLSILWQLNNQVALLLALAFVIFYFVKIKKFKEEIPKLKLVIYILITIALGLIFIVNSINILFDILARLLSNVTYRILSVYAIVQKVVFVVAFISTLLYIASIVCIIVYRSRLVKNLKNVIIKTNRNILDLIYKPSKVNNTLPVILLIASLLISSAVYVLYSLDIIRVNIFSLNIKGYYIFPIFILNVAAVYVITSLYLFTNFSKKNNGKRDILLTIMAAIFLAAALGITALAIINKDMYVIFSTVLWIVPIMIVYLILFVIKRTKYFSLKHLIFTLIAKLTIVFMVLDLAVILISDLAILMAYVFVITKNTDEELIEIEEGKENE